jgi:outer membrane protein assembly complex protein YaeT
LLVSRIINPLLMTLLLGLSLSSSASAVETGIEASRRVRKIRWIGIEAVSENDLEAAILTEEASWNPWAAVRPFDQGTWEQDIRRLERLYQRKGFYGAEIRFKIVEQKPEVLTLEVTIEEGEPVILEAFSLSLSSSGQENFALEPEEMKIALPLQIGAPFSSEKYQESKDLLEQQLATRGYPSPLIEGGATVDPKQRRVEVEWRVEAGPLVRMGATRIKGLDRVSAALVLGEVKWKPDETLDPRLLRQTQRAIFALGLFRSVAIQPLRSEATPGERPGEEVWPLEIRVRERSPRALRAAVGYGTEDGVRAKVEWKHRNFFGGLRTLRIGAKYSFLERGVEAVFVQPRFLDLETKLTLDTVFSQETEPAFDTEGFSLGWLIDRPVFELWKGRIGERVEFRDVTNVAANTTIVRTNENESFFLHFFEIGLRRSSLDSGLDPTTGSWIDLSVEPSFTELGSDVNYVKAIADGRRFVPLPWGLVLGGHLKLGVIETFGGSSASDLPVFKRFFSGGNASVRGFRLDALGPLDDDKDPIGGRTLAEASLELRFPIWRALGGVVFADAGQVALGAFELQNDDFFYSTGAGLRYSTPIGPLRLDFGRILNPPSGVSDFRIHFSVGHAF